MELLTDPQAWIAFLTLTALELVLGIDKRIGNMNARRRRWPPSVGRVTVT